MQSLDFNEKEAYQGRFESNDIEYDAYRVTYCSKPIEGLIWYKAKSEDYFTMNIKVPCNLSAQQKKEAQILVYNPWGGDCGRIPSPIDKLGNDQIVACMKDGWVVVEPGMRGHNCYTGTIGQDDFYCYGKLPWPLVDLKAAIRYLRYNNNSTLIPGNKDRIWIAGTSSGGCASTIIGTSGDDPMFEPYLEQIGAANTSDAVYGSAPSCPVANRGNGDPALVWERWNNLNEKKDADIYNVALADAFPDYFNNLKLKAEMDVPTANIHQGDLLTDKNLKAYLYAYLKQSGLKFFAQMSKEEVMEYLSEEKPEDFMYDTPTTKRDWIEPVFDDNGKVIDFKGTYDQFWKYTCGDDYYDYRKVVNWQYDKPMSAPDEFFEGNGTLNSGVGEGFGALWACPSSFSFGKEKDYCAVFSPIGQKWIQQKRNMAISEEYKQLIELQRNSVDPMHFAISQTRKIAQHWFLRTGTIDLVTPHPLFIGLGTRLMNIGKDVDIALVWDQKHGLTREIKEFINFAKKHK